MTYQTTPFTFTESGWSYAGGTFTVDSFTTIDSSNLSTVITDWNLTFSSPVTVSSPAASFTLSPSNSHLDYVDGPDAPNLESTPSALLFPSSPVATGPSTDVFVVALNSGNQWLEFFSQTDETGIVSALSLLDLDYDVTGGGLIGVGSVEKVGPGVGSTIATPEPSAFLCLALASGGLVAIRRKRQRPV